MRGRVGGRLGGGNEGDGGLVRKTAKLGMVAVLVALWALVCAWPLPVRAQEEGQAGGGFLTPFPPGDVYPVLVVGDGLAEGLLEGVVEAMSGESRLQVTRKHRQINSLMRSDFEEQMKALDDALAKEPPQIAIVMIGANDRIPVKGIGGERGSAAVGSEAWKTEYGRRVDRMMKVFRRRNVSLYWVGLPNMRRAEANEEAQMMNDIVRERVFLNGFRYVDSMAGFADEQGGYSDMGPDITGKIRRLREGDGLSFTGAGNRKLAHFLERELRRDLAQAKQDRNIPLAGSESEQAAIAVKPVTAAPAGMAAGMTGAGATGAAPQAGMTAPQKTSETTATGMAAAGSGDQKADPGRVSLKVAGAGGREEVVTLDIVRPAIPESVIKVVTRKESADKASQVGESVLDQIAGGVTVMSSITPPAEVGAGGRRKLPPTQAPYFRLLVKGERLTPRPGRADELVWPRPEPAPVVPPPPPIAKAQPAVETPKETPPPEKRSRRSRDRG